MQRRIILTILSAIVIAAAVVLRSHSSEAAAGAFPSTRNADTTIAAVLNLVMGERITFELTVTNSSRRRVELRFPNGRTHDFVVLDSLGREVWRWSEGKMFTQILRNRMISPGETITFAESWRRPDTTGTFIAVAQLWSNNYPFEERARFVIPAGPVPAPGGFR
jgi:hypothetical protein